MLAHPLLRACTIAAVMLLCTRCSEPREPIALEEGSITVENMTGRDWKNVRITLNDHFVGGVPSLAAGQRMNAPLSQFQTSFGARYERSRMSVYKIEVTATDSRGEPVKLAWSGNRARP